MKGQDNIIADFFSRTPLAEGKEAPGPCLTREVIRKFICCSWVKDRIYSSCRTTIL